eukprot:CAMPEP_0194266580 /NCGR_PEP_ID=MMETSP0169-20130528/1441_1 /TAXON_ID=218684 /ORGANISM="Corethron pennatum, Strain L29A3" /LENGTH=691 /DNA_ID=CAMNT_0039007299 /DNA_START=68 /DNA_END=2143 /DNA_ORIENTATION=+
MAKLTRSRGGRRSRGGKVRGKPRPAEPPPDGDSDGDSDGDEIVPLRRPPTPPPSTGDAVADSSSSDDDDDNERNISDAPPSAAPPAVASSAPTFASLVPSIRAVTADAVRAEFGFTALTPVQAAAIPAFLAHKDVLVQAVTGSGKTLAYLLPIFEMLARRERPLAHRQVGAVAILPTRELAAQVCDVARALAARIGAAAPVLLVGGGSVEEDLDKLESGQVLIGTPGRLEDVLVRRGAADLRELEVLVLDEADTLLDMGFRQQVEAVVRACPSQRRTGLFSATAAGIRGLRAGMRNPVRISVAVRDASGAHERATPSSLANFYLVCPLEQKLGVLVRHLRRSPTATTAVFFLTCASVEFFGRVLADTLLGGVAVEPLHGKMVQTRRTHALRRFREGGGALLCTDVAARGLDVSGIDWIVQFDPPTDPKAFVHRVGRTARAGAAGSSLVLLQRHEESYVDFLRGRGVPLEHYREDGEDTEARKETVDEVNAGMRALVLKDRDALEKGTKAYTSYIRAYKEHHCAFIFRFASLDLGSLATSLSLLRLPKMPELRDKIVGGLPHFTPAGPDVDIYAIPFLEKPREKARQRRLAAELAAGGKNAKQIKAERHAAEKLRRAGARRQAEVAKGRNPDKKRGRQARIFDEWEELAKEERLVKKLRKRKITQEEFDRLMYGESTAAGGGSDSEGEEGGK